MAFVQKTLLDGTFLGTSNAELYASPANTRTILSKLTVCNASGGQSSYSIYIVPSGATAADRYLIYDAITIESGQTVDLFECRHIMEAGDTLEGFAADASAISIRVSGTQVTK